MTESEKQAEELLPCTIYCARAVRLTGAHNGGCPQFFRPAVAAALAEKDAEIERLKDRSAEKSGLIHDLTTCLSKRNAANERLEKELQKFRLSIGLSRPAQGEK